MSDRFETNSALKKRLPALMRWAVFSLVCVMLCAPHMAVLAHAIDMYAQEQFIMLGADDLSIEWKITPGPLLADSIWAAADSDHDGSVSQPEARTWLAPFLAQCTVMLDGQPLTLQADSIHWPAQIDAFRIGDDALRVKLHAPWPFAKTDGAHHLQIHNAYLEGNSLNWFSVGIAADELSFSTPQQDNGQLVLDFGVGLAFTSWNSGQPDPTGMSTLLSGSGPATASAALTELVKTPQLSPLFLLGAFLLSLALGSLHALTPGHGKTLVAAYLVGSRGRSRDAVFLGLVVTLTHTGSVILLGLLTLLASQYILPGLLAPWLEVISGLLVVVFGLNLAFQRRQVLADWYRKYKAQFGVQPQTEQVRISVKGASLHSSAAGFGLLRAPTNQPHSHHHGPSGHTHLPVGDVTWKSLLALGISGGLVPCPDAIAILLVAVAINRIVLGMLLIVAFSVGLALVLILIGVALVHGARLASRNDWLNHFSRYTPLVSALVVSALGVGLTVSAINTLRFTSAAGRALTTPESNLLYLLPDAQGKFQLLRQPLMGGTATLYTHEPDGLAGYVLSPDKTRIVYIVLDAQGRTTFHEIRADGTGARLLLDCQQAQCSAPVWYPDGQRLVYQRADYVDEASLPRFSLWWLDANGETRPVFQDSAFASYAAAFSPDGQWLSYKSPANNTLQLYNLKDGRTIGIPVPAQAGALQGWSPAGDALLFWDGDGLTLQVTRYDLASGRKTNLGVPDQNDYAAVWSPDGTWVAIDREPAPSPQRKRGDQVWLVRSDGSETRLLLSEDDASYSDLRWSADGAWLVYTRYSYLAPGKSELWRVDVATGAMTRLVAGGMEPSLLP